MMIFKAIAGVLLLVISVEAQLNANATVGLATLLRCGFKPTGVLDVGANRGIWTHDTRKQYFPDANFFMIEGNHQHKKALMRSKIPFQISLVGEKQGKIKYYRYKGSVEDGDTGNSIFKETTTAFDNAEIVEAPIDTIDNIVAHHQVGPFQYMKLDIQGAEMAALKGATQTLKTVEAVQTEAPIVNYNQGAPSFLDLYVYMESIGFAMFEILELHRDLEGIMLQFDVLWVRTTSKMWDQSCTRYPRPSYFDKTN